MTGVAATGTSNRLPARAAQAGCDAQVGWPVALTRRVVSASIAERYGSVYIGHVQSGWGTTVMTGHRNAEPAADSLHRGASGPVATPTVRAEVAAAFSAILARRTNIPWRPSADDATRPAHEPVASSRS